MLPRVTVYTDGGCDPNPGPGGYGVVILEEGARERELYGGAADTTNNRMEMTAAVEALRALREPSEVHLWTDSQYLRNGITKWLPGWRAGGWMTKAKEPVKNRDLWEALDLEIGRHKVHWHWTRGHSGDRWNERADQLATQGIWIGRRGGSTAPVSVGIDEDGVAVLRTEPRANPAPPPETQAPPADDRLRVYLGVSFSGRDESGAFAAVLRLGSFEKTITRRTHGVGANRLHLVSAIEALKALKRPTPLDLYTASDYLKDGVTKWIAGWRTRGWKTKDNAEVQSRELWEELDLLCRTHRVTWHVYGKEPGAPPELALVKQLAQDTRTAEPSESAE